MYQSKYEIEEAPEGLSSPSAIDSDDVWERFIRLGNEDIIPRLVSPNDFFSKKDLYHPTLIDTGTMSFTLEKTSGKRCFMIGAKNLSIAYGDDPRCWTWISLPDSRFSEVAELVNVRWLKIHGKMETRLLSLNTTYAAYLVYKFTKEGTIGFRPVKLSISFDGGRNRKRHNVNLDPEGSLSCRGLQRVYKRKKRERKLVKEREDGWFEIEMGELFNDRRGNGEVNMDIQGMERLCSKSGLIIQGIELRPIENSIVDSNRDDGGSDRNEVDFVMPKGCFSDTLSLTFQKKDTLSLKSSHYAHRKPTPSSTFRSTQESDAMWERILPPDYKDIIKRSNSILGSKKDIYDHLCGGRPILMDKGNMSVAVEKRSGKKTYMYGAKQLSITWENDPRFKEVAQLSGTWLEIYGKMETRELSPKTNYGAYLVFKFESPKPDGGPLEVYLRFNGGEGEGSRIAYLDPDGSLRNRHRNSEDQNQDLKGRDVKRWKEWERSLPRERGDDGWMEIEMGEFFNDQGDDGDVDVGLMGVEGSYWKSDLIIEGIELRPKRLPLNISSISPSTTDSDTFWQSFLPTDCQDIISSLSSSFPSKKDLFFSLCSHPILVDEHKLVPMGNRDCCCDVSRRLKKMGGPPSVDVGPTFFNVEPMFFSHSHSHSHSHSPTQDEMSFALEKRTGKKCYMLGARRLSITQGDNSRYWTWNKDLSEPEPRFSEVAQLSGAWLEIHGMMDTRILSQRTTYAAYLVFKFTGRTRTHEIRPVEVYLRFIGGAGEGSYTVYLDPDDNMREAHQNFQEPDVQKWLQREREFPRVRGDGWTEITMGEFFNRQGDDGVVDMGLKGVEGIHWNSGLIIQGIELRPKDDAYRSSLVSSFTQSTVESNPSKTKTVESNPFWKKVLPSDYEVIISELVPPSRVVFSSNKDLYFYLCFHPILFEDGEMSFALEKRSGKKCYMLGAKKLQARDDSQNFTLKPPPDVSRFSEVAKLSGAWPEIYGKMGTRKLSPKTTYAAYLVFKFITETSKLNHKPLVVYLRYGDKKLQTVYPDPDESLRPLSEERVLERWVRWERELPRERGDGWMEIEMGEFEVKDQGGDEEVEMGLKGMEGLDQKFGLFIEGIELRPKESPLLDSDAFWERFLPSNSQETISRSDCASLLRTLPNKDKYSFLCLKPILIQGGKMSIAIDERSAKTSYMLGARMLSITWGDDPRYWTWRSLPGCRFSEVAELRQVCWLEVHGKMDTQMLSPKTWYKAYLVFMFTQGTYGLDVKPVKVDVKFVGDGGQGSRSVYLDPSGRRRQELRNSRERSVDWQLPCERKDEWNEIEMGEFFNDQGQDREVEMGLQGEESDSWKSGLIILGIEVRPQEQVN